MSESLTRAFNKIYDGTTAVVPVLTGSDYSTVSGTINGDVVVLFRAQRALAAGDMFTFGDATPELVDYSGGGSSKEWTGTLDSALDLDFDAVVPGHGAVTTKQEMRKFRDSTLRLRNRVHELIGQKKSHDDIAKMLREEFHWADLHLQLGLDGIIAENQ